MRYYLPPHTPDTNVFGHRYPNGQPPSTIHPLFSSFRSPLPSNLHNPFSFITSPPATEHVRRLPPVIFPTHATDSLTTTTFQLPRHFHFHRQLQAPLPFQRFYPQIPPFVPYSLSPVFSSSIVCRYTSTQGFAPKTYSSMPSSPRSSHFLPVNHFQILVAL